MEDALNSGPLRSICVLGRSTIKLAVARLTNKSKTSGLSESFGNARITKLPFRIASIALVVSAIRL